MKALTGCAVAAAALGGCMAGAEGDAGDASVDGEQKFEAFADSSKWLISRINAGSAITVCLSGDGVTDTNRTTLQGHITNSIMAWVNGVAPAAGGALITAANVTYACSSQNVNVIWKSTTGRAFAQIGIRTPSVNLFAGDGFATVLHEFGHIFGLADTYIEGVWSCEGGQPNSVMCGSGGLFSTLQSDDRNGIQEIYCMANPSPAACKRRVEADARWCNHSGAMILLGDFNGDGRSDMVCHDTKTGDKWLDYADSQGRLGTNDFSASPAWCNHSGSLLVVGDFNGDGRSDLLCHDRNDGHKWIDYADTSGQVGGNDWDAPLGWCNHASAQLLIGDFNGDRRSDMLCHDKSDGHKWIAYADANGQFRGNDWDAPLGWCNHASAQLVLGDFNGDGRSDMLCHDKNDGHKWIAYADVNGRFRGNDWDAPLGWCKGANQQIYTGRFNGDTRSDLLCHDRRTGEKWTAFANTSGQFTGTSRSWAMNWCSHSNGIFYVGDFNRDSTTDFLCHDTATGYKWQAFQYQ